MLMNDQQSKRILEPYCFSQPYSAQFQVSSHTIQGWEQCKQIRGAVMYITPRAFSSFLRNSSVGLLKVSFSQRR